MFVLCQHSLHCSDVVCHTHANTHTARERERATPDWFLTAVNIGFDPITILQPVAPGAIVSSRCVMALPDPVPTLESVTPLPAIDPLAFILHTEPMSFPLGPVAFVGIPTGPGVHPHYFESMRPGAGVLALALGSGADTVSVGFPILPPSTVSAAVVEVKPSTRHS